MTKILILSAVILMGAGCSISQTEPIEPSEQRDAFESIGEVEDTPVLEVPAVLGDTEIDEMVVVDEGEMVEDAQGSMQDSEDMVRVISMVAKQWSFTPSTVTADKNETVRLIIESVDVEHGFALPEFGISERLTPGSTVIIEFVAAKKGTFPFFCDVSCGIGHGLMSGSLLVR